MRINGFHQIAAFYSLVFSQEHDFKPQHISLYLFLLNQNNRSNWVEWFKVPIDLGMTGSCIGSKKTYYACLDDLQTWGLIKYERGGNMWKAPKISIEVLKSTSTYTPTVPLSEPLPAPQQYPYLHPYINDKPITKNIKQTPPAPSVPEIDFMGLEKEVSIWLQYKADRKEKYKSPSSIQVMVKKLHTYSNGNPVLANEIIEDAMAKNYSGFFELKKPTTPNGTYNQPVVNPRNKPAY